MTKQMATFMARGLASALLSLAGVSAQALEIQLPPETATFKPSTLPGYQLVQRNCSMCHSAQYIQTQPASSKVWWEGEIKKMKKTYGAPIPDADMSAMAEYLFATYGSGKGSDEANAPAPASKAK